MIKIGFFGAKFDTENSKRGILFIGSPGTYPRSLDIFELKLVLKGTFSYFC